MYTATKRQKKRRGMLGFAATVCCGLLLLAGGLWWYFLREITTETAVLNSTVTQSEASAVPLVDHTTEFYTVKLPQSWQSKGRKNPVSDSVYFEYQNTQKSFDNRSLRIYVDVIPKDLPINHLLPVTVVGKMIVPAVTSEDCASFSTPPNIKPGTAKPDYVQAKWQGVVFECDLKQLDRKVATASAEEGYGVSVKNSKDAVHKFFFVYIDRNVQADLQFLPEVVKNFQVI